MARSPENQKLWFVRATVVGRGAAQDIYLCCTLRRRQTNRHLSPFRYCPVYDTHTNERTQTRTDARKRVEVWYLLINCLMGGTHVVDSSSLFRLIITLRRKYMYAKSKHTQTNERRRGKRAQKPKKKITHDSRNPKTRCAATCRLWNENTRKRSLHIIIAHTHTQRHRDTRCSRMAPTNQINRAPSPCVAHQLFSIHNYRDTSWSVAVKHPFKQFFCSFASEINCNWNSTIKHFSAHTHTPLDTSLVMFDTRIYADVPFCDPPHHSAGPFYIYVIMWLSRWKPRK